MPRFSKDETIQFPKDVTLSHLLSKPGGFLVLSSLATVQKDFRQILDSDMMKILIYMKITYHHPPSPFTWYLGP